MFGKGRLVALVSAFAFGVTAASAQAAAPVIVNNVGNGTAGVASWIESRTGMDDGGNTRNMRMTFVVRHDAGQRITGVAVDNNWDGTDNTGTVSPTGITAEYLGTTGNSSGTNKLASSVVRFTFDPGRPGDFDCSVFGATRRVNKTIRFKVVDSAGQRSGTVQEDMRFVENGGCTGLDDYAALETVSQNISTATPGQNVQFGFTCDDDDSSGNNDKCDYIMWRWRRLNDGATSGFTNQDAEDNTARTFNVSFPQRGIYVVEAYLCGEDSCDDGTDPRWRIGSVEVESTAAPTGSISFSGGGVVTSGTPNSVNAGAAVTATAAPSDPGGGGGAIQTLEWDLDGNNSFDAPTFLTPQLSGNAMSTAGLSGSQLQGTVNTSTTGLKTISARVYDNGSIDGAGNSRHTSTLTRQIRVNAIPTASGQSQTTAEDTPKAITLVGDDPDDLPDPSLNYNITGGPSHGTLSGTAPNLTYTPDANYNGPDSFTFTTSDGPVADQAWATSSTATVNLTVTAVNDAPEAVNSSVTTDEDTPATFSLNATDVDGDTLSVSTTTPAHGSVGCTILSCTYTPAANYNGPDSFDFTVNDGHGGTDTATVSITVNPVNDAPTAFGSNVTTDEDTAVAIGLVATDLDGDSLSYTHTSPAHGTLTGTGASLTYTPAANFHGSDSFDFTVNDGNGGTSTATIGITVTSVNDDPVASDQSITAQSEQPTPVTLTASDVDGDALTYAVSQPSHGSVTCVLAVCTYTSDALYNGPDSFDFTVSDGNGGTDTGTVSVNVTPVNHAPVANDQSVTTDEDTATSVTLTASDPDGDTLSYSHTAASHGTVTGTGANLTYTPASNYHGPDSFDFTVSDGNGGTDTATVSITVTSVNDAPSASDSTVTTDEDTPVATPLTATDLDGDTLSYSISDAPDHGTLSGTAPALTYTPGPNFNGSDSFDFTVNDGNGGTDTATVSITVTPVNDAPVASPSSVTTDEDTAVAIGLVATDLDGDTLSYTHTAASHGTVTGSGSSLTYTPAANFHGSDSFDFTVSDGNGGTDTATISITVASVNDDPVFLGPAGGVTDEDSGPAVLSTSWSDVDGDTLTFTNTQGAHVAISNCHVNGSDWTCAETPEPNFNGPDSYTVTANDGHGGVVTVTVDLYVNPVNDAPVADDQSVTLAEDSDVGVTLTASDVEGDSLTYTHGAAAHGTVTGSGSSLTYTPAPNFNGTDSFTFTADDGNGGTDTGTVSITVTPVNDDPVFLGPAGGVTDEDSGPAVLSTSWSDVDGDTLTFTNTQGAHVAISNCHVNGSDWTCAETPEPNFNGPDSYTVTANDGHGGVVTVTVDLYVNPVNDAPVADDRSVTTDEDTAASITLSASDIDGDSLTYTHTSALHGTVTGSGASLTYTPNANYNGPDSFDFTVDDGNGGTDTATVSITVDPVNDAPTAFDQNVSTDEDTPLPVVVAGLDIDGDTLSYTYTQGAHGSVVGTAPNLVYTPAENFHGTDSFDFTVDDGHGGTDTATISITVNSVNDDPTAPDVTVTTDEDAAVPVHINTGDVDGDSLTYSLTSPMHGSLTGVGDDYVYTPGPNYNGDDAFTVTVDDSNGGTATSHVTIHVTPVNDQPVADDASVTTDEDTPVAVNLSAFDVDGDALAYSHGPASHGTVTGTGTALTYTPDANYNGSDSFDFTVDDGAGGTDTATITITINPVNDAPVASDSSVTTDEDTAVAIGLVATDIDGDTLAYSHTAASHGTVTGSGASLTYTPDADYHGPDSFDFTVSDGNGGTDTATVSITVTSVNDAPVAAAQAVTTDEDTAATITLGASDVDGDTLSYSVTQPAHGAVTCTGDTCTYTPAANYNGPDSFDFTVNDGAGGTDTATVSITVTAVNDAPVAADVTVTTDEDTAVEFDMTATDVDGDTLTYIEDQPSHGAVVCNTDTGHCTYTPYANFNGTDTFDYTVQDGNGGTDTATITINVTSVNDAPVAQAQSVTIVEDSGTTITLQATDVDGDALTYAATQPAHGTVSCSANSCSYTPDANYNGSDSFTFTVTDGHGGSDTATVSITIGPVNDAPVATAQSVTTNEDTLLPLNLGAFDVDGDSMTFTVSQNPGHGTVSCDSAGHCIYAPASNYNGADSFKFTVSDGNGGTDTATVSITVNPVNDAPTANPIIVHATEDTPRNFTLTAADIDGDSLTYTVTQPAHGTVSCTGTACTYTPAANYNGNDTLVYTVNDGHGGTVSAPVNIDVAAVNDAPTAQNVTVSTPEETAATFALLGGDVDGDNLTYTITSGPSHGTVSCAGALCTYTPAANYSGPDTLFYKVTDPSGEIATARVDITVSNVPHGTTLDVPPVIRIVLSPLTLQIRIQFEATLTRTSNGAPLVNKPVAFVVGGQRKCTATTNAQGRATCVVQFAVNLLGVLLNGGYSAVFDGDTDYLASNDSGQLLN